VLQKPFGCQKRVATDLSKLEKLVGFWFKPQNPNVTDENRLPGRFNWLIGRFNQLPNRFSVDFLFKIQLLSEK
jgi:hypothetical protein